MNETWIWIAQIVALEKSFEMIPNSDLFPGNWKFKIKFLTFAWAFEWMGIIGQIFHIDQKMRQKISHLLILIYRARIDAEKRYAEKMTQKIDFTGVEIAWVEWKSNKPVGLIIPTGRKYDAKHFSEFWPETPTQISTTHAFSKIRRKFQNRIPRELTQNF